MAHYKPTTFDDARDRLFKEIRRCEVLEAPPAAADEWLDDTVEFLAQEYPSLTRKEVGRLRRAGDNYVAPAIPHGVGIDARNRDEWSADAEHGV